MNENFISENESSESIKGTFIALGYIVATISILMLFAWSYFKTTRNQYLLLIVLSIVILVYSLIVMSMSLINKEILDKASFEVLFNISIFMVFLSFAIFIFFMLKAFNILQA